MGMDDSGPIEIVPGTPERRIIDYKYANGVLVQSFQGQLNPKFQDIPAGFDPATRFSWQILFVGDRGWIVAGREGPLKASRPEILADVLLTPPEPLAKPDAKTGATSPQDLAEQIYRARGYAHHDNWIQSIRLRSQPVSNVEAATRSTNVAHLGEHRHLDGPHAEVGSDQGGIHRGRDGQSHAPEGDAGALDDLDPRVRGSRVRR